MQVGHDQQTSTNCKSKLLFGLDKQLSTLVLKFNIIFSISSGCQQTEYYFPTCIKPCSLWAIPSDTQKFEVRQRLLIFFCFTSFLSYSQDTAFLKVHFLYGSKPLKKFKGTEQKWFGGILGGHVGIEGDSDQIINFLPSVKFHWFAKNDNRHSTYAVHSTDNFYTILGGTDSVKKAIFRIPVTRRQKQRFDSIANAYLKQTPYDYALFGMRCGAAAYEILGQVAIVPSYSRSKTYKKIFYPKKLRRRLFRKAKNNGWEIIRQSGSLKRKWEKD